MYEVPQYTNGRLTAQYELSLLMSLLIFTYDTRTINPPQQKKGTKFLSLFNLFLKHLEDVSSQIFLCSNHAGRDIANLC